VPPRQVSARRNQYHHPLDIRAWVIGKTPDEIFAALDERIEALNAVLEPALSDSGERLRACVDFMVRFVGFNADALTPDERQWTTRFLAWTVIARYWAQRPYNDKYLPRIATRGSPWEVSPDEIHFLDLPAPPLLQALHEVGIFEPLTKAKGAIEPPTQKEAIEWLVELVKLEIHHEAVVMWVHPITQVLIFKLLKTAHYSARLNERREAKRRLEDLLSGFVPDLSQHISRREENFIPLLNEYERLKTIVEPLHRDLKVAEAPITPILKRAQKDIDPTITKSDLQRWRKRPPRDVVLEILSTHDLKRRSPRTLANDLSLAEKARKVHAAWEGVRAATGERQPHPLSSLLDSLPPRPPRP